MTQAAKRFENFYTKPVSERVEKLRQEALDEPYTGDIDWEKIYTRVYKETEGEPMIIRRGKIFSAICREYPIDVTRDDSLMAGYLFQTQNGAPFTVSQNGNAWGNQPLITDDQKKFLEKQIIPYWAGKDNLYQKTRYGQTFARFSDEQKNLFFQDPNAYPQVSSFIADAEYLRLPHVAHTECLQEKILAVGLKGFIEDARQKLESFDFTDPQTDPKDHQKVLFLKGVIMGLEAACEVGPRFAKCLWEKAKIENNPKRKEELLKMAEINNKVPANPPETLWEALQTLWTVHFLQFWETPIIGGMTLGRLDQYLYRFYRNDITCGRLTDEDAQELIDCFCCKLAGSLALLGGKGQEGLWAGAPIAHHIDVGGMKPEDGSDATNKLSYMFIESAGRLRLTGPNLGVLLHNGSPDELLRRAVELLSLGLQHPYFFNNEALVELALNRAATLGGPLLTLAQARNCGVIGCSEHTIRGHDGGYIGAGMVSAPHFVEFAFTNGKSRIFQRRMSVETGDPREFKTFDDLLAAVEKHMRYVMGQVSAGFDIDEMVVAEMEPTVFQSAIIGDCIQKAIPREEGGARYNHGSPVCLTGCADAGNSLAAVKKLVFDEKKITMQELCDALDVNFEGFEEIRQMCLNVDKFGNDIDETDQWVAWVARTATDIFQQYGNPRGDGKKYTFQIPLQHAILGGMVLGALPSGRTSGYPVSDGASPTHGSDLSGPFAVLRSISKTSPTSMFGGNVLNMRLDADTFDTDEGYAQTMNLLRTFVDQKLTEIQFNVVSNETLRDAQKNPENHKGLMVRVAGYSAYFTRLPKPFQDAIINRTEHHYIQDLSRHNPSAFSSSSC